jgi:hypothetical protein
VPREFTKVYNNTAGAVPSAVQLDCTMYYMATNVLNGDQEQETLFLYLCGIYYTTSPWLDTAKE